MLSIHLFQILIGDILIEGSEGGDLLHYLFRTLIAEIGPHLPGEFTDYLPVGSRVSCRRYRLSHALDISTQACEGTILFSETGGGKHYIRALHQLRLEAVLHHQEIEAFQCLLHIVWIRRGEDWIIAHYQHSAHRALHLR